MKLTILGSGTCVPTINRSSPGYFLETNNTKVLLDCGPGTLRQMIRAKKDLYNVDAVFLSHLHTDHVSDLFAMIQALSWTPELKSKNFLFNRKNDLHFIGGKGFKKWFTQINKIWPVFPRPNTFKIKLLEFKKQQVFKGLTVKTQKSNHTNNSVYLKFVHNKKTLVYGGDMSYNENISKFAQGCDLLILECAWPDKYNMGHLTPKQCGALAQKANTKKLILTHFYPPMEKVNIKKIISKYYKGQIIIAEDLMQIKI